MNTLLTERSFPMKKKLVSLILSLLLCLSLLPGQACAADTPDPLEPSAQVVLVDPKGSDEPENPVMPMASENPIDKDDHEHTGD